MGSLIGDTEDVQERKRKAAAAYSDMDKIWIRGKKISLRRRMTLYNTLVKQIMIYNAGAWGITKAEEASIDAYHRQQLRRLCGNYRLSSKQVYQMCRSEPISNEIRRARYRLLGHCLRLDPQTPAQQAMNYYFENIIRLKQFNGTARNTIAELISKEIKLAAQQDQHCNMIIKKFETRADLDWL